MFNGIEVGRMHYDGIKIHSYLSCQRCGSSVFSYTAAQRSGLADFRCLSWDSVSISGFYGGNIGNSFLYWYVVAEILHLIDYFLKI